MTTSGWKTTEAWVTGLTIYMTTELVSKAQDHWVQVAAVLGASLVASVFIWSRTRVKEALTGTQE